MLPFPGKAFFFMHCVEAYSKANFPTVLSALTLTLFAVVVNLANLRRKFSANFRLAGLPKARDGYSVRTRKPNYEYDENTHAHKKLRAVKR